MLIITYTTNKIVLFQYKEYVDYQNDTLMLNIAIINMFYANNQTTKDSLPIIASIQLSNLHLLLLELINGSVYLHRC